MKAVDGLKIPFQWTVSIKAVRRITTHQPNIEMWKLRIRR
jgi:hypothetical protein